MKKILALFLICASLCFATDYYVDPSRADDSGNGLTTGAAKKTIDAAYNAVSDGDTIYLMAGTYDASTQGAGWQIDFDRNDVGVTLKSYTTEVTLTIANTSRAIDYPATGAVIKLEDITITTAAAVYGIYREAVGANAGQLILDNVAFTASGASLRYGIELYDLAKVWFYDSDFTVTAGDDGAGYGQAIRLRAAVNDAFFDNCTITNSSAGAAQDSKFGIMFSSSSVATKAVYNRIRVKDCTITSPDSCINIGNCQMISVAESVLIEGNTCTNTHASTSLPIIRLELDYTNASMADWDFNTAYSAGEIVEHTDETAQVRAYFKEHATGGAGHTSSADGSADEPGVGTEWQIYWEEVFQSADAIIRGNTVTSTNTVGHGIYVGNTWRGVIVENNYVYGCDWQIVVKGNRCVVRNNIAVGKTPLSFFRGIGNVAYNNTLVGNSVSHTCIIGDQNAVWAKNTRMWNNIIVQNGNNYVLTFDGDTADRNSYVDYNCYWKTGTGNWFECGGAQAALSNLRTKWSTYSLVYPSNDASSIALNPAYSSTDYVLTAGSPCINTGKPGYNANWKTSMGAWSPSADLSPGFRSRYSPRIYR